MGGALCGLRVTDRRGWGLLSFFVGFELDEGVFFFFLVEVFVSFSSCRRLAEGGVSPMRLSGWTWMGWSEVCV